MNGKDCSASKPIDQAKIGAIARQYASRLQKNKGEVQRYRVSEKFSSLQEEETIGRLLGAYSFCVDERGVKYRNDSSTVNCVTKVGRWLHGSGQKSGLLLYGKTGTGKTTMLRAIGMVAVPLCRYNRCLFVTASDYVHKYLAGFENVRDEQRCDVLLLDDLGSEPVRCMMYGMEVYPILDLLYYRYDKMLTTVITSNLEDQDLRKRYGERLYDRMVETYDRLYYMNESYRQKNSR